LPDKGSLPELVDQVWALMTKAMEQNMDPEMATLKQTHGGEFPSQARTTMGEQSSKPTAVRVVGMDESSGSSSVSGLKGPAVSFGYSEAQQQTQSARDVPGQLVIGEGKSQYIPSPFWASMSEVCTAFLDEWFMAKIRAEYQRGNTRNT
jgi:hypothetical protein